MSAQTFDFVVYGGTAGGVITAVSAAREGLKVALLEPGRHLGGMATGGLTLLLCILVLVLTLIFGAALFAGIQAMPKQPGQPQPFGPPPFQR